MFSNIQIMVLGKCGRMQTTKSEFRMKKSAKPREIKVPILNTLPSSELVKHKIPCIPPENTSRKNNFTAAMASCNKTLKSSPKKAKKKKESQPKPKTTSKHECEEDKLNVWGLTNYL